MKVLALERKRIQLLACVGAVALGTALIPDTASAQGAVCGTQVGPFVLPLAQGSTNGLDRTACGNGAVASSSGATAVGVDARALAESSVAIGDSATANETTGSRGIAIGVQATSDHADAIAVGGAATATGDSSIAVGNNTLADSLAATAVGTGAQALAESSVAIGDRATANETTGSRGIAIGVQATSDHADAIAVGGGASATGDSSVALGNNSRASALASTAVGSGAQAHAQNSSAFGNGATVAEGFNNSTALGTGATANASDQIMLGTQSTSYQAPGITSPQSLSRQSGPLQLVTTDMAGHLASDNGAVFKGVAKAQAGVAIALALEAPNLGQHENFGLRLGWGNLDGDANAWGMSAAGVLCRGCLGAGTRVALDGGVGFSHSDFMGYRSESVVAGRAGVQVTWK
jgi:hypothetical protein